MIKLVPLTTPLGLQKVTDSLSDLLGKAVNSVTETTGSAKESLERNAEAVKEAVSQSTAQAITSLNQVSHQASGTVLDATEKAKLILTESTDQTVHRLTEASHQAVSQVTRATEEAKLSLESVVQQAEKVSNGFSNSIEASLASLIQKWMEAHPLIYYLMSHPLQALGLFIITIFLFAGLINGLWILNQKLCSFMLRSPLTFIAFISSKSSKKIGSWFKSNHSANGVEKEAALMTNWESQKRIVEISRRLDELKSEENSLLKELVRLAELPHLKTD